MQLLPKRNYAEMLIILLVTILYSLCPADLKQALGISESFIHASNGAVITSSDVIGCCCDVVLAFMIDKKEQDGNKKK